MSSKAPTSVTLLDRFGFLAVTGKDAQSFLQGYTTCDLVDVTESRSGLGATCNIQGRMVTSFRIVRLPDGFLLRMDKDLVAPTRDFLKKYIVFSKATMADVSGEMRCFGVIGQVAGYPENELATTLLEAAHVLKVSASARYEVWASTSDFTVAGAETVPADSWWAREVEDGFAWVSTATANEFIPQMFGYHETGGIDFDKGCYLGQEIVARMQYRGAISRKLFRGSSSTNAKLGDVLVGADGKSHGVVVAAASKTFLAVIQAKDDVVPACTLPDGTTVSLEKVVR